MPLNDPLLVVKLVAVPILVLSASLAARKWGPSIGGFIIGLPLTSGPVLVFISLEQGPAFAASAAVGTLLGVVPLALYCLTFNRTGFGAGWQACLFTSTAVYFATAVFLSGLDASLALACAGALLAILVSLFLMRTGAGAPPRRRLPWWEVPARMIAATTLVVAITEGAPYLGPRWSGLLAPYPIYATVFAVFMHRFDGPSVSAPFLKGVVVAALAATAFFFTFGSAVPTMGTATAAGLALCATILVQGTTLFLGSRAWRSR